MTCHKHERRRRTRASSRQPLPNTYRVLAQQRRAIYHERRAGGRAARAPATVDGRPPTAAAAGDARRRAAAGRAFVACLPPTCAHLVDGRLLPPPCCRLPWRLIPYPDGGDARRPSPSMLKAMSAAVFAAGRTFFLRALSLAPRLLAAPGGKPGARRRARAVARSSSSWSSDDISAGMRRASAWRSRHLWWRPCRGRRVRPGAPQKTAPACRPRPPGGSCLMSSFPLPPSSTWTSRRKKNSCCCVRALSCSPRSFPFPLAPHASPLLSSWMFLASSSFPRPCALGTSPLLCPLASLSLVSLISFPVLFLDLRASPQQLHFFSPFPVTWRTSPPGHARALLYMELLCTSFRTICLHAPRGVSFSRHGVLRFLAILISPPFAPPPRRDGSGEEENGGKKKP